MHPRPSVKGLQRRGRGKTAEGAGGAVKQMNLTEHGQDPAREQGSQPQTYSTSGRDNARGWDDWRGGWWDSWTDSNWNRSGDWQERGTPWSDGRSGSSRDVGHGARSPPWRLADHVSWTTPRPDSASALAAQVEQVPALPRLGSVDAGRAEVAGPFVQALHKHDRRWSRVWVDWRHTRPAPPGGRRALNPISVPGEAQAFVESFALGQLLTDWDRRTRASVRQ